MLASAPHHAFSTGQCTYCGHCAPCAVGISVADVNKYLNLCLAQGEVPEKVLTQLVRENKSNSMFSEAALWKQEGKASVSAKGTGRAQTVSVYRMAGQQSAVFGKGLWAGRYFMSGESSVCLIDRETIRTLFGSEDVLGMKVRWKDTQLEIVGILEGGQPLCMIPGKDGDVYAYFIYFRWR